MIDGRHLHHRPTTPAPTAVADHQSHHHHHYFHHCCAGNGPDPSHGYQSRHRRRHRHRHHHWPAAAAPHSASATAVPACVLHRLRPVDRRGHDDRGDRLTCRWAVTLSRCRHPPALQTTAQVARPMARAQAGWVAPSTRSPARLLRAGLRARSSHCHLRRLPNRVPPEHNGRGGHTGEPRTWGGRRNRSESVGGQSCEGRGGVPAR